MIVRTSCVGVVRDLRVGPYLPSVEGHGFVGSTYEQRRPDVAGAVGDRHCTVAIGEPTGWR
jgi:hypothetical protein